MLIRAYVHSRALRLHVYEIEATISSFAGCKPLDQSQVFLNKLTTCKSNQNTNHGTVVLWTSLDFLVWDRTLTV